MKIYNLVNLAFATLAIKMDKFISLVKNGNYTTLTIADNGKGYDIRKMKDSFGLELIKSLVQDELKGSYKIYTKNGTKYTMTFKF